MSSSKVSTFIITINSNKVEIDRDTLIEAAAIWLKQYLPHSFMYHKGVQSKKDGWEQINSIEIVTASYEVGTKFGRGHLHTLIRLEHDTNIQVEAKSVQKIFEKLMGVSDTGTFYVNSKYVKDGQNDLTNAKKYIEKGGDIISFN